MRYRGGSPRSLKELHFVSKFAWVVQPRTSLALSNLTPVHANSEHNSLISNAVDITIRKSTLQYKLYVIVPPMSFYNSLPLNPNAAEIRLIVLQPGCEEEVIRCDLIKVSLHEITPSEDDPYALQNIPNTAPWLISHGRYVEVFEACRSFVPGSRTAGS